MCQLKSALVLKDGIFCPDHDSHDQMLEELGINDTERNAETRFVRVELSPKGNDIFSPVDNWELKVDQDIRPDWFFVELEEPKIRAAVKEWAAKHIFDDVADLELRGGGTYYLRNCKDATLRGSSTATLWDSSTATLWDSSTATLCGSSTATLHNSSTATLYNSSTATLWDSSTATLWDSSTATLYDSSTATLYNSSTATLWDSSTATLWDSSTGVILHARLGGERKNYVLMDNSTLKDCKTKTIYQAGEWKYVEVGK